MKPYPNEELDRMSKREIIRLYKRTVEQFGDAVPVKHGKWIDITESHIGTCSLCGDRWGSVDMMNYCPYCGARMEEE